ncbi:MAG: DUF1549 and DUF1553 domain-containing protein [Planctomycetota bacterium]|nr:DUF1549 and DUF1553 domain-containing protein [Planctomycetota bacterium]
MMHRIAIRHAFFCLAMLSGTALWAQSPEKREWPFYPLPVAELPEVRSSWIRNGIDAFILERLNEAGLEPAPEATRQQLVRRLYLDLIGLPPSPEDVEAFIEDESERAYEALVDRLLNDPRYGERWARLWLDLARYADTAGYEGDPDLPHAWRYRDYVIDAFNSDKSYTEFIKEQIAGDEFEEVMGAGELPEPLPERVVAMTFLRLAPFTEPRGDESRHELLSEMTSTVGSVFLGLTVGCAKCHDHKYDSIPTKDFYRLQAFFATISMPRPEPGDGFQIGGSIPAPFYRRGEQEWANAQRAKLEREIDDSKQQLEELEKTLTTSINPDASAKENLDAILADDNNALISAENRQRYRWLSNRERFLRQQLKRLQPVAMSLRHSFGPPYEPGVPTSRLMIRGEYDNPGEAVTPGFLSCITGNQGPASIRLDPFKRWPTRSRRMALAQWIASPDNPLTARVMANRLWHWHFGRGIVETPSDFGQLSGGPSHAELLDWLALQLVKENWSLKALHRLIVTSATYRQTSLRPNEQAAEIDPDNKLLWRFRRRRLEAEAVRDSVLVVSGRLNSEQFGLPIFPPLPDDIEERVKFSTSKWDTQHGPQGRKRSIYIYQQRTLTMPLMQSFDALVCDESRPRRRHSVTPLQALAMYNGQFVSEEAKHFAARVNKEAGDDITQQIELAYRIALSRAPSPDELAELKVLAGADESGLAAVCRVLLNSNEFIYVD